jgi:phosphate transport system protein
MAYKVQMMIKDSLDALVHLDVLQAQKVRVADDDVDLIHKEMYEQVQRAIVTQPQYIEQFIHSLSVSRFLERMADHATNIAEDVIYLVEGNIVRHTSDMYKSE